MVNEAYLNRLNAEYPAQPRDPIGAIATEASVSEVQGFGRPLPAVRERQTGGAEMKRVRSTAWIHSVSG